MSGSLALVRRLARCASTVIFVATLSGCALLAGLRDPDHVDEEIQLPAARRAGDASTEASGGTQPPPACAADVTSDANNCGWCGHTCRGGPCRGGICEPTKLSGASASALAADDERFFYIADDDVRACSAREPGSACRAAIDEDAAWSLLKPEEGSGGPSGIVPFPEWDRAFERPRAEPRALALHGDRVFVLDEAYRAVIACPKSRCDAASVGVVDIAWSTDPTGSLAVGPTRIVWGERDGIGSAEPPAAGRVAGAALLESAVASRARRVHVADLGAGKREVLWLGDRGIFSLGLPGGGAPSEVVGGGVVADFALDAASLYVASGSRVERIDRATGARSLVANLGDVSIASVVADASGVFALVKTALDERVLRVHDGGAAPIAVASGIEHVALSSEWLYFAGEGGIFRVAR